MSFTEYIESLTWKKIVVLGLGIGGLYFLWIVANAFFGIQFSPNSMVTNSAMGAANISNKRNSLGMDMAYDIAESAIMPPIVDQFTPSPGNDRMVVTDSSLSLVAKDVIQVSDQIVNITQQEGGYMVNKSLTRPEESPFASVTVRVPSANIEQILQQFKNLAIKVASETINGHDVTDEYSDIETRLATLRKTKGIFEDLLDSATNFDQILRAKQEILQVQNEIDSLIGRQQYLAETAKFARVTVYISADELSLPYAPGETWRPQLTVKLAVRSLVAHLRQAGNAIIWIAIYGIIWLPLMAVFWIWKSRKNRKLMVK